LKFKKGLRGDQRGKNQRQFWGRQSGCPEMLDVELRGGGLGVSGFDTGERSVVGGVACGRGRSRKKKRLYGGGWRAAWGGIWQDFTILGWLGKLKEKNEPKSTKSRNAQGNPMEEGRKLGNGGSFFRELKEGQRKGFKNASNGVAGWS